MKTPGLCLASGVSVLPLALESAAPELALESTRAALVLLPWLALASLPSRSGTTAGAQRAARSVLEVACFALLPLSLALGLDHADQRVAWANAGVAYALLVVWTLARELAAARERSRRFYALLWLALVPGLAALSVAGWAGRARASGDPLLAGFARASPLEWIYRSGRDGTALAGGAALALGIALLVLACSALSRAGEVERSAA